MVIVHQCRKNVMQLLNRKRFAVRQRFILTRFVGQSRGLRTIASLCELADDTPQGGINSADAVLRKVYML